MKYFFEKKRLPVFAEYDVAVIGGGIAGAAAAVASSRNRVKTCLIEKQCALGGLATLGNVITYLPLCDGMGKQVIKGLGEEMLKLSISDGYSQIPSCWQEGGNKNERLQHRYRVNFNASSFALMLETFMLDSGVEIMYDTRFCGVRKSNGIITHVIIENKDGRSAVACKAVVDASGDADVCAASGEKTVSLDTNISAVWYFAYDGKQVMRKVLSQKYDPEGKTVPEGTRGFAGDRGKDVTEQIISSRNMLRSSLREMKKENPDIYPVNIPTMPTFRMTRRLKGSHELQMTDERKVFDDTIGMTGDWRKKGPVYYIPLRALAGVKTTNLLTAGRCISSDSAWDMTRAIPTCVVTGEAAGTAAALLCRGRNRDFAEMNIKKLQSVLKNQNVLIEKNFSIG